MNPKAQLRCVNVRRVLSAKLGLCCLVVLLLATTAQRLLPAAADVTVITPHLHISDLLSDWTADNLAQFHPCVWKLKSGPPARVLLVRWRPRTAPESGWLSDGFASKVPVLTECIRWPRPSQSQSGEVSLSHTHRSRSSMQTWQERGESGSPRAGTRRPLVAVSDTVLISIFTQFVAFLISLGRRAR